MIHIDIKSNNILTESESMYHEFMMFFFFFLYW